MTGKNFIGYALSAEGDRSFGTSNPLTGEQSSCFFFDATHEEVERAVQLAQRSFNEFNNFTPARRAEFLFAIAQEIELLGDNLIEIFCFESGLSFERADVELRRALFQLQSFADALIQGDWMEVSIDTADPQNNPQKPDLRKMMTGIGPVVVFGASNFPLAYSTAGGDTASALAAGCPVIVKSHPLHAGTGSLVAEAIVKAAKRTEMPEGVFSNLNSNDFAVGKQLVLHSLVKAVGFTGSLKGGRSLFDLAASRKEPIPVFAEMGSTNPVVVFNSAIENNGDQIAALLSASITNAAGQFCTKPGIILVEESNCSNEFIVKLGSGISSSQDHVMLHASIHERFEIGRVKAIQLGHQQLFENSADKGVSIGRQTLMVVDSKSFQSEEVLRNEVFGPFAIVVVCQGLEDILNCIERIEGSLTASIFVKDVDDVNTSLISLIQSKVGRVIFNGVPTGVSVCPSMNHGGPYPATTDSRFTAVGIDAMKRFLRPVSYQNFPQKLLPLALQDTNELGITRRINGERTK